MGNWSKYSLPVERKRIWNECIDDRLQVLCGEDQNGLCDCNLHLVFRDVLQPNMQHLQHLWHLTYKRAQNCRVLRIYRVLNACIEYDFLLLPSLKVHTQKKTGNFTQPDNNCRDHYQVLQHCPSVFEQCVQNDTGGSGAIRLGVHQTFKQHEDQGVQLLLRQTLTDDLPQDRETEASIKNKPKGMYSYQVQKTILLA